MQGLYFIQEGLGGPVKIGVTADPHARLATLQAGNPSSLHLLGFFQSPRGTEQRLHSDLAAHRLTGEWFKPHADVFAAFADCHEEYVIGRLLEEAA